MQNLTKNRFIENKALEALNRACDALLIAGATIGLLTDSRIIKSTNSPGENTTPLTYKYESRQWLENGNEQIIVTIYSLNPMTGMLEFVKEDVKEVSKADA